MKKAHQITPIKYLITSLVMVLISPPSFTGELTNSSHLETASHLSLPGKIQPSIKPEIFAPGVISLPSRHEFGIAISDAYDEIYFGVDIGGRSEIYLTKFLDNQWAKPELILTDPLYSFNDPMLSNSGDELYFISDLPTNNGSESNIDIWYVKRLQNGWSKPVNAGNEINSHRNEYYISFTNNGSMYFSSNIHAEKDRAHDFDIYKSNWVKDTFQKPQRLPAAINTRQYEADVYVAPDESYLIFSAVRKEGLGRGDLYISFKDGENNWTQAINMKGPINDDKHQLCPFVTKDGKYLFYTSNQDIHWVSTSILDRYKQQ